MKALPIALAALLLAAPAVASDTDHCKGLPSAEIGPCISAVYKSRQPTESPSEVMARLGAPVFKNAADCSTLSGNWKPYQFSDSASGYDCYDANDPSATQWVEAYHSKWGKKLTKHLTAAERQKNKEYVENLTRPRPPVPSVICESYMVNSVVVTQCY